MNKRQIKKQDRINKSIKFVNAICRVNLGTNWRNYISYKAYKKAIYLTYNEKSYKIKNWGWYVKT